MLMGGKPGLEWQKGGDYSGKSGAAGGCVQALLAAACAVFRNVLCDMKNSQSGKRQSVFKKR